MIAELAHLALHAQGRVQRTLWMVFVCERGAEKREYAIAGRLDDVAVVAAHGFDHQSERRIDDGAGLFGVEVLGETRRVDDVDEECRYDLALALGYEVGVRCATQRHTGRAVRNVRAGGDSRSTGIAEPRSGRAGMATPRTIRGERISALATEPGRDLVFCVAPCAPHDRCSPWSHS